MTDHHNLDAPKQRPKAYSYLRFSTPEQSKGDSYRRQMSMAVAYAEQHGLELDHELTFHDVGVSAYRGQNTDAGRLAYFKEAVRSGQVPQGSILLVEQLDRISRLTPRKALRVLEEIVETGVSVVTLTDGRHYTAASLDTDHFDLMMSILTFMRANEESATKSRRLKAAWEGKRANMTARPMTARAPAWLRLSMDRSTFEELPDRVELVQRMFSMTLAGVGQHRVAATFNQEGHTPWGRGQLWHRSYIAKTLANPAVIGTFVPHLVEFDGAKKRRVPLDPVEGYFPAIVTLEVFQEAQALRQAHGSPQRGRHAHFPVSNILSNLAACPKCAATMTRVAKGKRSKPYLVCTKAKGGAGCTYKAVPYALIEGVLLQTLPERLRALEGVTGPDDVLEQALNAEEARVSALQERIEALLDNLSFERSPAIMQRLREQEDALEQSQEALRKLQQRQEAVTGRTVAARVSRALEALEPAEGEPAVAAVNLALRSIFRRAVIDWTAGRIDLEWTHGGTCTVPYPTFGKWPAPAWAWQDEEEVNDG